MDPLDLEILCRVSKHYGFFCKVLSKKYLEQISLVDFPLVGTNKQKNQKDKDIFVILILKVDTYL